MEDIVRNNRLKDNRNRNGFFYREPDTAREAKQKAMAPTTKARYGPGSSAPSWRRICASMATWPPHVGFWNRWTTICARAALAPSARFLTAARRSRREAALPRRGAWRRRCAPSICSIAPPPVNLLVQLRRHALARAGGQNRLIASCEADCEFGRRIGADCNCRIGGVEPRDVLTSCNFSKLWNRMRLNGNRNRFDAGTLAWVTGVDAKATAI